MPLTAEQSPLFGYEPSAARTPGLAYKGAPRTSLGSMKENPQRHFTPAMNERGAERQRKHHQPSRRKDLNRGRAGGTSPSLDLDPPPGIEKIEEKAAEPASSPRTPCCGPGRCEGAEPPGPGGEGWTNRPGQAQAAPHTAVGANPAGSPA